MSSLPKIKYPIFELTLPSTKETIKFRPFTVKEEKLLLIAQEGDELTDRLTAIRQVVNNCMLNLPKDVGLLPSFDLEYCFLKLRSKSVGNEIQLTYRDNSDEKNYDFEVDLDKIEITFDENHNKTIQLTEDLGVVMEYPTIETIIAIGNNIGDSTATLNLIKKCISTIFDNDNSWNVSDYTDKEITEFIESIPTKQFEKISDFFETTPVLKHDLHYTDSAGTEKTITLQGISDFFQ